jgi:hypothetical protein
MATLNRTRGSGESGPPKENARNLSYYLGSGCVSPKRPYWRGELPIGKTTLWSSALAKILIKYREMFLTFVKHSDDHG